jgi:uracil-DNA glycosylase family 4
LTLEPGSRPVPNYPDYVLIRKLGAGAFGQVWHAHGPGGLDVALKFIHLDAAVLALELRSLDVMKSIRHPNLVSLFGAWQKDSWLILAMELCDCTLLDRLTQALNEKLPGIPLTELLAFMNDAANGLDALNAGSVQHRDVKPANLLLLNTGVKVADFGLAKMLEQTVASNSGAGTIAYTAPECFRGKLTQYSDQYSLAVTYYHLRTGQLLFKGDRAKVMYAHLEQEPDLSALPAAEVAVLGRALSKEPKKRWPSCGEFAGKLLKAYEHSDEELSQRRVRLEVLAENVASCTRCPELCRTRTKTVFGAGDPGVDVCFVGEAPGADEDTKGEPFVGPAGQMLNKIISACGMKRREVYLSNALKCRPPGNRTPLPSELANCQEFLERELELVRPKVICALGTSAVRALLGITIERSELDRLRGRLHVYQGIPVLVTYHPAFLLPGRHPEKKADVWEDMKLLLRCLGRPIPEEYRNIRPRRGLT